MSMRSILKPFDAPRKMTGRWYSTPVAIIFLGMLSAILLTWINQIRENQRLHSDFNDTFKEIELEEATSHLWLEERIAGDTTVDMEEVWAGFDNAIGLSEAVLKGGQSATGSDNDGVPDPAMRAQAQDLKSLLVGFKALALERYREPETSGIGGEQAFRFDAIFRQIMKEASSLGAMAQENRMRGEVHAQRLFIGILVLWVSIVVIAAAGFWNRERQRKAADEALRKAHDELEGRVEERTVELSTANALLRTEVSERRRAEESIRLYEEVVNNMPLGLYVCRRETGSVEGSWKTVATNPVASRFTGITPEEVLGKPIIGYSPMLPGHSTPDIYTEVLCSGKARDFGEVQGCEGGLAHASFSVKAFPLPHDSVGVVIEDVSERKRAENALRESESKFRTLSLEFHALLDAIPDSLTLLSPDLKILWANRAAAETAGRETLDLTGKDCHEICKDPSISCHRCAIRTSLLTGKPLSAELAGPDGRTWNVRAFPTENEEGKIVNAIVLATDITAKIALQAEAMRAAHLASLGELAAGVAHEVNNPLNGIINYAQILFNESGKEGRVGDISGRIIKEGARIASIVKGLLSFARERKEEKMTVPIHPILSDSLALTESQLQKHGIHLLVDVPADLPDIVANPQQIQQVFLNIISNARYALNEKYAGRSEDKVLRITAERVEIEKKPCLRITFHDHGTGMSADTLDRVLVPFFSTKPSGKGTGLGLCISHGIIGDHGGRLTVDSVHGQYTKVIITLPAKE